MASFTDNQGRRWSIELSVATIRQVRRELNLDLLDGARGDFLERLSNDPVLLADLLYVLCRDQARERGVTDEDFGRSLAGDAIDAATLGLLEGLVDFFPQRKRSALRLWIEKMRKLESIAIAAAEKDFRSDRMERKLREILDRQQTLLDEETEATAPGSASTSWPGSSGSTPAPLASGPS